MNIKSSLQRNHCVEKLLGNSVENIGLLFAFSILVENIIHIQTENISQKENSQTDTPHLALTENSLGLFTIIRKYNLHLYITAYHTLLVASTIGIIHAALRYKHPTAHQKLESQRYFISAFEGQRRIK